jgi:hypothetical protein
MAARTADSELTALWLEALDGRADALEQRLARDSRLPGPRANLELAHRVVEQAIDRLLALPADERRAADPRVLRQALGYAVSVVAAADPTAGVPLLERLATSEDQDARWIARENLKKARLKPLADRLSVARDALSRA